MAPFITIVKDPVKLKNLFCKCWSDSKASVQVLGMTGHATKLVIVMECHDCVKNHAVNQWDTQNADYLLLEFSPKNIIFSEEILKIFDFVFILII